MVGISEGAWRLTMSLSGSFLTVWKSVSTSDAHSSAVVNSVGAGVSQGATVSYWVSEKSDGHLGTVSYSVSQMGAVS